MEPFTFIGVPIDSVGRDGGTEHGPRALRDLGLPAALGGADVGDLPVRIRGQRRDPESGILAAADVLAATVAIRAAVAERIGSGERPFLAGGCCAELPGALAGARDALGGPLGLVHFDGHLDLYDGETSPTGEAADIAILGFRDREESRQYGMRQPEALDPAPILHPAEDLRAGGAGATVADVEEALAARGPFWLHFDIDVLDRDVFAATDYLLPGGLEWPQAREVLGPLLNSPALIGASVACYNPEKDPGLACGTALIEALRESLA